MQYGEIIMKKWKYDKLIFISFLALILLIFVLFGISYYSQHTADAERQLLLDIINADTIIFSPHSILSSQWHSGGSSTILWDAHSYEEPIWGKKVELSELTKSSIKEVIYLIVINDDQANRWRKQRDVEVVLCEVQNPDLLSETENAATLHYNDTYYFVAFQGNALQREYYSVINTQFLIHIIDTGRAGLSGTRDNALFGNK